MSPSAIEFVSLGMVVLDELKLPNGDILQDCIGGSGAYSTLGARIVSSHLEIEKIGSFIIAGQDFPDEVAELIRGWGVTSEIEFQESRRSTRGRLEYHDQAFARKTFQYLTEPLQPTPGLLSHKMICSSSFHVLYRPLDLISEMKHLSSLRSATGLGSPVVVWEPFPSFCTQEHLEFHLQACKYVDVFSPNHLELQGLYGESSKSFDKNSIEILAQRTLDGGKASPPRARQVVVVRAGEHGCLVVSHQSMFWLSPYHVDSSSVIDATGGGNTFLGAFTIVLVRTGDLRKAAIAGSVAASFAIEQIGLPKRDVTDGPDRWNGEEVLARLKSYDT